MFSALVVEPGRRSDAGSEHASPFSTHSPSSTHSPLPCGRESVSAFASRGVAFRHAARAAASERSNDDESEGSMASKRNRQTFEKLKREQAVKERRLRKQERKAAARLAKLDDSGETVTEDDALPPAAAPGAH